MDNKIINGKLIKTEDDFHKTIAELLDFGPYYGNNLDALWDRLSTDIERPLKIIWNDSEVSKKNLREIYDTIINLFQMVKQQDQEWGLEQQFDFECK